MTQIDFYVGINKIVNYFERTTKAGFLFCAHDKTMVLLQIAKTVIERAKRKKLDVKEFYMTGDDVGDFWRKIKEIAKGKPDGVIISNLDELIVSTKDQIIKDFNFSRDILLGLDVQVLFCLTRENVAKFANQASDLYLRRDREVIFFPDPPGETALDKANELFTPGFRESGDFKSAQLKIGLLEKQLREAEQKNYKPERVANEIALDLVQAYLEASLSADANRIFDRYIIHFNLETDLKAMEIVGNVYYQNSMWTKALELSLKSLAKYEEYRDEFRIARELLAAGALYSIENQFNNAFDYFSRAEEIIKRNHYDYLLPQLYINLGQIYYGKGELNKALDYYSKTLKLVEEPKDKDFRAMVNAHIGAIYFRKGELDKALHYYLNTKEICAASGGTLNIALISEQIGNVYNLQNQPGKALENYRQSKQLLTDIFGPHDHRVRELESRINRVLKTFRAAKHEEQDMERVKS
jgi:tetratricopeptide (TPR) repeat protein